MPRRSQRSRGRERQEVAMPVLRLRRSEPGSCGCTGLPLPASLNLSACSTGTIGPHTQGRAHRFPPYWRGALPAAWTNPESRRRSIPTPALPFPHPRPRHRHRRSRYRAYSTRTGSRTPSRTWSRTSRETRRSGPSSRWLRNEDSQGTNSGALGADQMADGGHSD